VKSDSRRRLEVISLLRVAVGPTSEADLESVAASANEWEAQRGEVLVSEGHLAPQGFVLLTGTAGVSIGGQLVARLAPGSAVWPTPGAPMPVTVTADGHVWLLLLAPTEMLLLRGD
jgi:hypothetical protein